jgi:Bacterial Ig-like domain (group 2)
MLTGRKLPITLAFIVLIGLAVGVSCRGFFVNPTLTSITVGPTGQTVAPGKTLQMVATGTFDSGPPKNITTQCLWNSSDTSVATIGLNSGLLTAAQNVINPPVTTTITATDGTLNNSTTVKVCPDVTVMTVTAIPTNPPANSDVQFNATATFSGGTPQDVTAEVTWNISNTAVIPSIGTDGIGTVPAGTSGQSTNVSATLCNFTSQPVTITVQ